VPKRTSSIFLAAAMIAFGSAWLDGCAGDPMPPGQSPGDPANPAAPEAPTNASASVAQTSTTGPANEGATDARAERPDAGVVYTCPMHPEVQSNAPGRCPKCGMTLVVKKP
jgi:hypothetical protein